jgi:hypothetical protein
MFGFRKTDKSISVSLPADGHLHGVKIKKLPIGAYIKAIGVIKNLPEILLKNCFPDQKPAEVMESLKSLDQESLYAMLGRLMQVVPEQFLHLVAELIDTDYDHLVNDLTPKELFEVLRAFWEVNDTTDFMDQIKKLWPKVKLPGTNTGFKV